VPAADARRRTSRCHDSRDPRTRTQGGVNSARTLPPERRPRMKPIFTPSDRFAQVVRLPPLIESALPVPLEMRSCVDRAVMCLSMRNAVCSVPSVGPSCAFGRWRAGTAYRRRRLIGTLSDALAVHRARVGSGSG
jgi:hypothetical protein